MTARLSAHVLAQVLRFVRVSGYAFVAQLLATGGTVSWASLLSLAFGAGEVGLREVLPVKPIPAVASVLKPPAPADPPSS